MEAVESGRPSNMPTSHIYLVSLKMGRAAELLVVTTEPINPLRIVLVTKTPCTSGFSAAVRLLAE